MPGGAHGVEPYSGAMTLAGALARACHPAPCVAVTTFAFVLGVLAGAGTPTAALFAAAVLAGQLSIGWSNDRLDAARDLAAGRSDKPFAGGRFPIGSLTAATGVSALVCVALSLSLGWAAGLVHLGAVGCGWLYNAGLKATLLSWLPYALAFGALPVIACLAAPGHRLAPWWLVGASAVLGVVANLVNTLPDQEADALTGVRAAAHRLGARGSLLVSGVLLLISTGQLVFGPAGSPSAAGWGGLGLAMLLVAVGLPWAWRRPTSRATFLGLIVFVALQLALLVLGGDVLSAR